MAAAIRCRAAEALTVEMGRWEGRVGPAARLLRALDAGGLAVVDAAALRALLDRCELRSSGSASCCVCDGRRVGEPVTSIPHVEECPVRVLRASLPREEG